MENGSITVSGEWIQITDGTNSADLQVLSGYIWLKDQMSENDPDSPPSEGATGFVITNFISITAPSVVWIKAPLTPASVYVE